MTYFETIGAYGADGPSVDAFGRWRISDPVTQFDSQLKYNTGDLFWEDTITGGSVTHLPNESAAQLSTGAGTSGNKVYRQTRQYMIYQPGKSQLIVVTGLLGAAKANVRQRVGYFDADNGAFFEQTGSGISVVVRSKTSGSVVDTAVPQASWNLDKMNGTGPSGFTLNTAFTQIFTVDAQWLGVGRVRFGIQVGGQLRYVHQVLNANLISVPYTSTFNLPVRWEIENTAAASGATTLKAICASVISEGGFEEDRGIQFGANNGITIISVTTRRAILSIRPKATYNSITNRVLVTPRDFEVLAGTNPGLMEVVYNPTFTGTPVWADADTASSSVERSVHGDAAAGAFTGGIVVASGYVNVSGAQRLVNARDLSSRLPFCVDAAGANPRGYTIALTSNTGTLQGQGSINWKEIR